MAALGGGGGLGPLFSFGRGLLAPFYEFLEATPFFYRHIVIVNMQFENIIIMSTYSVHLLRMNSKHLIMIVYRQ